MSKLFSNLFDRSVRMTDQKNQSSKNPGKGYSRVPSKGTLSTSTTNTSLATDFEPHHDHHVNEFPISGYPEEEDEENYSPDEEEDFEKTRLHFQQQKHTSIGSANKYKMEMESRNSKKEENLKNTVPFVKQISTDSVKIKDDYSINGDLPPYRPTTQKINVWPQFLATIAVSLGSMVVGFTSGYTSPALVTMQHPNSTISVNEDQASWVGGLMPLAALVGGILGGTLIVKIGRRNTLIAIGIPFSISWIIIATAPNVYMVYVGRTLGGLCVGIGSLTFPVYLGEALQPEVRGQLGLFPTAFGNVGILVCFIAGKYMDWSILAYFGAMLPVPYLIMMFFIPETPRWYIANDKNAKAKRALIWLRGKDTNVNKELEENIKAQEEMSKNSEDSSIFDLFRQENLRPVMILMGLMFFQQMSGINALIFYTVKIFKSSGSTIDENLSTIIVGVVNFVSTFVAAFLIDRLGRKILLYISGTAMVIALMILGTFYYLLEIKYDTTSFGWLPLMSCVVYVLAFSFGFGPIPWLMMGEILPGRVRGSAASLATSVNWTCTFIVTKTFNDISESIGIYGTMWLFGLFTTLGLFFIIFFVPETRGKSLEDIEKSLTGKS
ncbi:facilitated trehalose transporter Tret1-like isoform X2 [Arctopsyche grandis]|uniref:facilitated trehalose transporter Tret1-like isoform X2 n=1 Tax=Arctopsyche grandis TaxID=121162 RepID=UPI00406D9165